MNAQKGFNDPIHGTIQIPEYCQWIIDTPEFQRLRYIKQLGGACYVFPGAVHTRFDHCLGVSHLAGTLATTLQRHQPSIQANEIACIQIAGLCHDLGHGPFSHVFESIIQQEEGKKWKHEEQSVVMFEYLTEKYNLQQKMRKFQIHKDEIEFICELILGRSRQPNNELIRGDKFYLYQIVNNSVNRVDVDKCDYFARDAHFLGMKSAFEFSRILPFVRVGEIQRPGGAVRKELCFRDKLSSELNRMFFTRRSLHYAAYRHRVTCIIEIMLRDALLAASKHLLFLGRNGIEYNLRECVKDPEAFYQVNNSIIQEIMRSRSSSEGMVKARQILDRIHNRQLYKCIVEIQHAHEKLRTIDPTDIRKCLVVDDDEGSLSPDREIWRAENLEITVSDFDYGMRDENPLLEIPFYTKWQENSTVEARLLKEDELPADFPKRLKDVPLRIFTKVQGLTQFVLEQAKEYFDTRTRHLRKDA